MRNSPETRRQSSGGKQVAMLIGGLAAGVLGSRLLPPLVAMATGAARAKRSDDPFALLIDDHRKIQSLLQQMERVPADSRAKRMSLYLLLKRKLAKHALAEEDVVYPILYKQAADTTKSKELYDEHADIKIFLFELERKIAAGEDWSETVHALSELIDHHIHDEEHHVFPTLRQLLDQQRKPVVSGQISREEAMVL